MFRRRIVLAGLLLFVCCAGIPRNGIASMIMYRDVVTYAQVSLGADSFVCNASTYDGCATLTITGIGDTSTVRHFSVPGADGYKNALSSASLDAQVYQSATGTWLSFSANFLTPVPFIVAVDNTNQGAGFDTPGVSPTYPVATYASYPPIGSYALASNFGFTGYWAFCAVLDVCSNGSPLATDHGLFSVINDVRPASSSFESLLIPGIPEPGTLLLFGMPVLALARVRRWRTSYYHLATVGTNSAEFARPSQR